jgi:isocitrate/isopropylmalate dehydrogenase
MCLAHLGESAAAEAVEAAAAAVLPALGAMGGSGMGYSTAAIGDQIATAVTAPVPG